MIADDAENSAALLMLLEEGKDDDALAHATQQHQQESVPSPTPPPPVSPPVAPARQMGGRPLVSSAPPPAPVQVDPSISITGSSTSRSLDSFVRDDSELTDALQASTATTPLLVPPRPQVHERTQDDASAVWTSSRRSGRRRASLTSATDTLHDTSAQHGGVASVGLLNDGAASAADSDSASGAPVEDEREVIASTTQTLPDDSDVMKHEPDAAPSALVEHQQLEATANDSRDQPPGRALLLQDLATEQQCGENTPSPPSPRYVESSDDVPPDSETRTTTSHEDDITQAPSASRPTTEDATLLTTLPLDGSTTPSLEKTPIAEPTFVAQGNALEIPAHVHGSSEALTSSQHSTFMTEVDESSGNAAPVATRASKEPPGGVVDLIQFDVDTNTESSPDQQQQLPHALDPSPAVDESEWIVCATEAGDPYYYNLRTHESRWTPPTPTHRSASPALPPPDTTSATHLDSKDALFAAVSGVEPFAAQLESLLQDRTSLESVNSAGLTPLQVACQSGNTHAVSMLLYYGAKPDATGARDTPAPLLLASWSNHSELVQLLLDYGAQLSVTDAARNSVLHVCVAFKSFDALLLLLDRIAHSDASTPDGEALRLLNHRNRDDETPLHIAAKTGFTDAVGVLLEYGAATDAEDSQGRTPLVLGILESQIECVQLLQKQTPSSVAVALAEHLTPLLASSVDRADAGANYQESTQVPSNTREGGSELEQLQTRIAQLASYEASSALRLAIDEFALAAQRRMRDLAMMQEDSKTTVSDYEARIEQLTAENAQLVAEVTEEREERVRVQTLLEAQGLELSTLRASHSALATRCEMLDGIARGAQEKLRRERVEQSQYHELLENQVRASMDENASLAAALNQLEAEWNERLELQQQQLQQQTHDAAGTTNEDFYAEAKESGEQRDYYSEYEASAAHAVAPPTYEQYAPPYYSAGETGTLTPTEEPSEFYYSHEHDSDGDNAGAEYFEQDDDNDNEHVAGTRTVTPQMSPTRVGAVWNRFFENMAVAAERQDYPQQQQASQMRNSNSRTPAMQLESASSVFMAIRKSNLAQLQQLLLSGVSPNVRDIGEKGTPLHLACELGDLDAMQLLCEFAADVEVRDESENTPLLVACSQGHFDCVKFLLQSAADLSVVNANGDSALHLAAWDGSADCIEILAEYGVDPLERNGFGLSPLANLKSRSPLRHRFDDLVDDHPMRRALLLLEELEQQAVTAEQNTIAEHSDVNDEADVAGGQHKSPEQQRVNSNEGAAPATKHVSFAGNQTAEVDGKAGDATRSATSWKDWLFGFASGKATPLQQQQQPAADEQAIASSDARNEPSRMSSSSSESDEESSSDIDGVDDNGALLIARRHEPLKPPPEIEAELQRAKLQLQRPAALASETPAQQQREGRGAATSSPHQDWVVEAKGAPQSFVAADRTRLAAKSLTAVTAAASAAQNVRTRYVDTFNTV